MKIIKKLFLFLAITASIGTFSTSAVAYEEGRTVYSPASMMDLIIEKINATGDAIDAGAEGEATLPMVKEILGLCKEINASDTISRNVSRIRSTLKKARTALKSEQGQVAKEHLDKAAGQFKKLKTML